MTDRKPRRADPSYRLHRPSNQAFVELNGRRVYLGKHGTAASRRRYAATLAEWKTRGRTLPVAAEELTVIELCDRFMEHADRHYRLASGRHSREFTTFKSIVGLLIRLYGEAPVSRFGPLALKAVRQRMIELGWVRSSINRQVCRIRHVFRWGVACELVDDVIASALEKVAGLQAGRTEAAEADPVRPVPEAMVDAIKGHVSPTVWAMVQVQRLTGMRPGEVCAMRAVDVNMTERAWTYSPRHHKTAHHGKARIVFIGPKAQAVIAPHLADRPIDSPLFSAAESARWHAEQRHLRRRTPLNQGNRPASKGGRGLGRAPGNGFDVNAYRRAIERGCDAAFPPPEPIGRQARETVHQWKARLKADNLLGELREWRRAHRFHPHQLRHNAATAIAREFGIERARIVLGHATLNTTLIYAEADQAVAAEIAAKIG